MTSDGYAYLNHTLGEFERRTAQRRAVRKREYADSPRRDPIIPVTYEQEPAPVPECLADPDCRRPITTHSMCARHAAKEGPTT